MNDLRTAAQQALEALRCVDLQSLVPDYGSGHYSVARLDGPQVKSAITAMEAALAEPTVKESLQVESAFAENATTQQQLEEAPPSDYRRGYWNGFEIGKREGRIEAENALAEPVQEQPVCDECGKHKRDGWALYCVDCVEPVFALSQPPDSKHAKEKA